MRLKLGQIELEGKDLAELKELLAFLPTVHEASQALGVTIAPSVTPKAKVGLPTILAGGEPYVEQYLAHPAVIASGKAQFRLTASEKEAGITRNDAARMRLELMTAQGGQAEGGAMGEAMGSQGEAIEIDLSTLQAEDDEEHDEETE